MLLNDKNNIKTLHEFCWFKKMCKEEEIFFGYFVSESFKRNCNFYLLLVYNKFSVGKFQWKGDIPKLKFYLYAS